MNYMRYSRVKFYFAAISINIRHQSTNKLQTGSKDHTKLFISLYAECMQNNSNQTHRNRQANRNRQINHNQRNLISLLSFDRDLPISGIFTVEDISREAWGKGYRSRIATRLSITIVISFGDGFWHTMQIHF